MKLFTFAMIVIAFSLSSCSSQKKLVDNPPFELGEASCQSWKGGRAETGSGMLLEIPVMGDNLDNLKMQEAYCRGKVAPVTFASKDGVWMAKANFMDVSEEKADMVMHSDGNKEVGNQPPKLKGKFPFELEPTECVVSYLDGGKLVYVKIDGIKEKKPLIYQ